ncbi:UDP-N-acetylmuramoyl-L-alanine--D-glutamate ligase [Maribacter sp. 2307ULW6-5]|uniref:UDP-N-acetylmuramoyl-L-alanine--D-glutamate ligase n=1 Tax=Maribacter sp. 2307ULW6-5 TaxID=3386275 RepID=UPI0039BC8E04
MQRLVVLGAGESGVGTALLAKKKGYAVFVSDLGEVAQKYRDVLEENEIEWEGGQHTGSRIMQADLVMKSPGIPDTVPLVRALREKGVPVISEIEFAARHTKATLIAITGSNGKTTTTMLTHHILKTAGLNVGMAGNIGDSFAKMVSEEEHDYYVLEVSSFQLDGIVDFKPHIGVITNITPDHLDRYEHKFENYVASKFRMTMNQDHTDYLIYDGDDLVLEKGFEKHGTVARRLPFSLRSVLEQGAFLKEGEIHINTEMDTIKMTADNLALEGQHNLKNTMAAATIAKLVGIRKQTIRECVTTFQGAPHRLEQVLKIHHVKYVNDSKATNVNATYYALESVKSPIVWIVGGVDKGNDYKQLMPLVREKVKAIICLGLDNASIKDTFGNVVDLLVETFAMEEAVKVAYKIAERGDTVLLSPACASFDLFKNYEDRGDQFKNCIKNL